MRHGFVPAFAISLWLVAGPAGALDVGVGGVSVGADVDVGGGGVSVGIDADVGGVAGADVGASVGSGGASVDVDVDGVGGASVGGTTGSGTTTGGTTTAGTGGTAGPATGGTEAGVNAPGATPGVAGPKSATQAPERPGAKAAVKSVRPVHSIARAITLPPLLRPAGGDRSRRGEFGYPARRFALNAKAGVLPAVVRTCRTAIASAARPLGATKVEAVSAGRQRRIGSLVYAPIDVRIQYARQGGREIRQAKVSCRLNASGRVVAVR